MCCNFLAVISFFFIFIFKTIYTEQKNKINDIIQNKNKICDLKKILDIRSPRKTPLS